MAYMSQEHKKELAPKIKAVCKKYGVKATLSVANHSTLVLNVKSAPKDVDFQLAGNSYEGVNTYHIEKFYSGKAKQFLSEVHEAMMIGNFDKSDIMTDYFHVGWYTEINIGRWNKPFEYQEA